MMIGLQHASGDTEVPMDGDRQGPPELIPQMVACWRTGAEVVLARRGNRASDTVLTSDYSYGIYLYGWPCQQLALMWRPGSSNIANTVQASLMALLMAALSWHLIEHPAMTFKNRLLRRQSTLAPGHITAKST